MATQWTEAQRAAIEAEGGSLLVSAAAGSGKTAVLVERAVRLITRPGEPLPADRLLILTFTNAAAEELRARIAARLEQEVRARPQDVGLRRQRMLLRRAFIGTIDAFCVQLVRENFSKLGIAPDVAVGDAALLGQLSDAALAATMEEMYQSEDFARLAALYGNARSDSQTEQAILALYDYTRTLPSPRVALEGFAAMYESGAPLRETAWGEVLLGHAQSALETALGLLESGLAILEDEPELLPYERTFTGAIEAFSALLDSVRTGDWDGALARARYSFAPFGAVRGYDSPGKRRAATLRDEAKKILAELNQYCFAASEAEFAADRAAARPLIRALVEAVCLYEEKLDVGKLAEKVLDFPDFEHLALRLLRGEEGGRSAEADRIAGRYGAVMVDEYQDTNELQSALYECLGDEAGANLFYVGDVKQSIYRFRLANPGIFLAKKAAWAPFEEDRWPAVLTLGHNFRSGGGVIGGVNYLFGEVMSEALGEVRYDESERLIQGGEGGDAAGFELCLARDEGGADAAYVAGRIGEMVEAGYEVRDKDGPRPCGFGDFAILLRSRTRMADYVDALEARGIPVASDISEALLDTPEVLPLRAAVAAIDNPGDDVHLAATLVGPLFGFSPDEVTALRAATPAGGLWGALVASEEERVQDFIRTIGYYRALSTQMPAGRLCETLVEDTGYLSAVAAMEGGLSRRENLLRFIGWAKQVSAAGRGTLHGFVRLLEAGRVPEAPGFKGVGGHVSLLTIHKSKGLEFPVVFLAGAARRFNMMDTARRVQMHARLGVGLWLGAAATAEGAAGPGRAGVLYPTLPLLAIRRASANEALSEEMRVLYVALTRAKEKVIVTLGHREPERLLADTAATLAGGAPPPFQLARAGSMAGWVLSAALRHPDAAPLLKELGCGPVAACEAGCRLTLTLCDNPPAEGGEPGAFTPTAAPDEALVVRLRAGFAETPARLPLTRLPAKVSVSQLAGRSADDSGEQIRARPSFMYKAGLTAAERGTAMHTFLQHADYAAAGEGLEAEIERLVARAVLTPEAAGALDRAGINAFLASPLAQRMAGARQILREYDFITAIPAGALEEGLPAALADERVLVQGIVDAVLVFEGEAEIVDYKTDRGKTAGELAAAYRRQLTLYREAVEKRLCLPVRRLTLWSFALAEEIEVK